jgi:hypothetical protein
MADSRAPSEWMLGHEMMKATAISYSIGRIASLSDDARGEWEERQLPQADRAGFSMEIKPSPGAASARSCIWTHLTRLIYQPHASILSSRLEGCHRGHVLVMRPLRGGAGVTVMVPASAERVRATI